MMARAENSWQVASNLANARWEELTLPKGFRIPSLRTVQRVPSPLSVERGNAPQSAPSLRVPVEAKSFAKRFRSACISTSYMLAWMRTLFVEEGEGEDKG